MLGRRWSLARGVNKTERVQLIDGLGLAGIVTFGGFDVIGSDDSSMGYQLSVRPVSAPITVIQRGSHLVRSTRRGFCFSGTVGMVGGLKQCC